MEKYHKKRDGIIKNEYDGSIRYLTFTETVVYYLNKLKFWR